jgi:hypothetical protein
MPACVLAGLSLLATACGGSAGSHVAQLASPTASSATRRSAGSATTDKYAASLAYSRCMRAHGLLSFPDPAQVGGEIQISGSRSGVNPQSPLFLSAERSCRHLLPGGGVPPTHVEQQRALARLLRTSQCMRAHGISGFPDPALAPPSSRSGYSAIRSNGIGWLAVPSSIDVRAPAFEQAAAACNF